MVNKISDNSQPLQNPLEQTQKNQPILSTPTEQIGKQTLSSPSTSPIPTPPPLENITQMCVEYWTLTRRIPKNVFKEINQAINALPDKEIQISQLLTALKDKDWKHGIFKDKNYPFYALEAVKLNKMSSSEFCTLMFYWTANRYHTTKTNQVAAIPLFLDGKPNPQAVQMLKETMKSTPGMKTFESTEFLTNEQLEELFRQMEKAPSFEQQFFLVPQSLQDTIFNAIQYNKINIFGNVRSELKRMIPSFTLMQRFLDIKFGPQAIKINPVIGLSHFKDIIANGAGGQRDMAIPFPGVTLPEKADNLLAPGFDFSYHDFYHAFIVSSIPLELRQAFVRSAYSTLHALNDSNADSKEFYAKVIDMEATGFRSDRKWPPSFAPTKEEIAWLNLFMITFQLSSGLSGKTFDPFLDVLIDAIHHRSEWKEEFGLSPDLEAINSLIIKYFEFLPNSYKELKPIWQKGFKSLQAAEKIQSLFQQNKDQEAVKYIEFLSKDVNFRFNKVFFAGFTDKESLRKAIEITVKNEYLYESADFSGCKLLDDSHIKTLFESGYKGRELYLSGCTQLTGEMMKFLSESTIFLTLKGCTQMLNSLQNLPANIGLLDLSGTKGLNDNHIAQIVSACPNLGIISLNRSPLITDQSMIFLKSLPNLGLVNIDGCSNITDEGLYALALQPRIFQLSIEDCPKITKDMVDRINIEKQKDPMHESFYLHK